MTDVRLGVHRSGLARVPGGAPRRKGSLSIQGFAAVARKPPLTRFARSVWNARPV